MTEPTAELVFGMKAGQVWEILNKKGPSSIESIVKASGLRRDLVYGGLGWLGREDKIVIERRGRAMIFSLRESEACTTTGNSVPQVQPAATKKTRAKKTKKAPKAKTLASTPEAVKKSLNFILSELEASREPTPAEVSKAVGMDSRQLGIALSKLDIKSKPLYRGGKSVRIYSVDSKEKIAELAGTEQKRLKKMSLKGPEATQDAVKS
ncbi:MAG: winged helix-turn-helix domain-containing protein [Methanotrichaceae archaeon]|nr:winged helix-turn-helix domain-containing protein [Methanotrichaceae archaeon]